MSSKENNLSAQNSLFPELLSQEELLSYVNKYLPKMRKINDLTHERLVEIYRQMFLPRPQRQYRNNWRGRLLLEKRMRSGLQAETVTYSLTPDVQTNLLPTKRPSVSDRLKPPPVSTSKSTIYLGGSNAKSDLDKIIINKRRSVGESTKSPQEEGLVSPSRMQEDETKPSRIVFKRTSNELSQQKSEKDEPVQKPKRVKIMWP